MVYGQARAFEEQGVEGMEKLQQQPFASADRAKVPTYPCSRHRIIKKIVFGRFHLCVVEATHSLTPGFSFFYQLTE